MKKSILSILGFILMMFCIKFFSDYFGGISFQNNQIKKEEYNGIINNFYIDVGNHNYPYAVLDTNKKVGVLFNYSLLRVGDRIIKKKGATNLIVIRKDSTFILNLSPPGDGR